MARKALGELKVFLDLDPNKFKKELNKSIRSLDRFGRQAERLGGTLTRSLTLPLGAAGIMAIKTAAKFESLRVQMDVLTGSVEEGGKAFQRLVAFSARTPFQLLDLAKLNNQLIGFGLNSDQAFVATKRLADIIALTGANMGNIAIAYGQAAAEGKLLTRDIRQFINNGVPLLDLLANKMGVSRGQILGLAEDGKISFEVLNEAIRESTEAGGKFFEGTKKLSGTLGGLFSTLRDNVSIAFAEIGQNISDTLNLKEVMAGLSNVIGDLTDKFKALSEEQKVNFLKTAGILLLAGPLLLIVSKLVGLFAGLLRLVRNMAGALAFLVNPANKAKVALLGLAAAFIYLEEKSATFRTIMGGLREANEGLEEALNNAGLDEKNRGEFKNLFKGLFTGMKYFTSGQLKQDFQTGVEGTALDDKGGWYTRIKDQWKDMTDFFKDSFADFGQDIEDLMPDVDFSNLYGGTDTGTGTALKKPLSGLLTFFNALIERSGEVRSALSEVASVTASYFSTIGEKATGITAALMAVSEQAKSMTIGIANYFIELSNRVTAIKERIAEVVDHIGQKINTFFQAFFENILNGGNVFQPILDALKRLFVRLLAAAAAAFVLTKIVSKLFPGLAGFGGFPSFKEAFLSLSGLDKLKIPTFAKGGISKTAQLAVVGDNRSRMGEAHIPFERMGEFLRMAAPHMPAEARTSRLVVRGRDLVEVIENNKSSLSYQGYR